MCAGSLLYFAVAALSCSAEALSDADVSVSGNLSPQTVAMAARPPVIFVPALASDLPGIAFVDLLVAVAVMS